MTDFAAPVTVQVPEQTVTVTLTITIPAQSVQTNAVIDLDALSAALSSFLTSAMPIGSP